MKKLLFMINLALSSMTFAQQIDRLQSIRFDRSQAKRIYLAPGLGSIVLFPCVLMEVFVGRSEDLKVQISPNDKKILFLNLKLNSSLPTNIIAKCETSQSVFVFDVIPSKIRHQDVVEIRNYFGRPRSSDNVSFQTAHEAKNSNRIVIKAPELVDEGRSK